MGEDFTKGYANSVAYVRGEYPGYEIIDSLQGIEIEISMIDSQQGDRKSPWSCAVACALKRQEGADAAIVLRSGALLIYHKDKRAVRYRLYPYEQRLIRRYDQTGVIEPQRFWLAPVPPTGRFEVTGALRKQYSQRNGKKKECTPPRYIDGVRNWHRQGEL